MTSVASNNSHSKYGIIGTSPELKSVVQTAEKIARNPAITTLIIGESGTGKEVIARLIHNCSSSASQPFVDINCGAIPENLLESELFGYEKGAFTGANARKQGLFELANGGTIFLDEIGTITLSFQAKLLKAVENKRFRRINGLEEINVSPRIVAATNIDLTKAVRQGTFREDLYYRLNVCQIFMPPLRSRSGDALVLATYFIEQFNKEHSRSIKGLDPSATDFVLNYEWPGNVRQLKNTLERAVLVEADEWIEARHLVVDNGPVQATPVQVTPVQPLPAQPIPLQPTPAPVMPTKVTEVNEASNIPSGFERFQIPDEGIPLEEIERNIILSALEKAEGNVSRAARFLRINRGKFRYRLERLNITQRDIYAIKAGFYPAQPEPVDATSGLSLSKSNPLLAGSL